MSLNASRATNAAVEGDVHSPAHVAAPPAPVVSTRMMRQVEDYHRILDAVGDSNYTAIKGLFSGEGGAPAHTTPAIHISFELFETVQHRFAITKQTLERTRGDLNARNQQLSTVQMELQGLRDQYNAVSKRAAEAEERNTTLHQTVAKQTVTVEQLRRETAETRAEMDALHGQLLRQEEELQGLQNRVSEGLVVLSQKSAAIASLRRELGKYGRYRRENEADDENGAHYTSDHLQSIAMDVEGRSHEARMKMRLADLENQLRRVEQEKQNVLEQHTQYRKHVEAVVSTYECETMLLQDGLQSHACIPTPYFLSSTYYQNFLQSGAQGSSEETQLPRSRNDASKAPEAPGTGSFAALVECASRSMARLSGIVIDTESTMRTELYECAKAQQAALSVSAELVGFLSTFEREIHQDRLTLYEVREEWNKARVPHFVSLAAETIRSSVTQLSTCIVKLLERENEYVTALSGPGHGNGTRSSSLAKISLRSSSAQEQPFPPYYSFRQGHVHRATQTDLDTSTHTASASATSFGNDHECTVGEDLRTDPLGRQSLSIWAGDEIDVQSLKPGLSEDSLHIMHHSASTEPCTRGSTSEYDEQLGTGKYSSSSGFGSSRHMLSTSQTFYGTLSDGFDASMTGEDAVGMQMDGTRRASSSYEKVPSISVTRAATGAPVRGRKTPEHLAHANKAGDKSTREDAHPSSSSGAGSRVSAVSQERNQLNVGESAVARTPKGGKRPKPTGVKTHTGTSKRPPAIVKSRPVEQPSAVGRPVKRVKESSIPAASKKMSLAETRPNDSGNQSRTTNPPLQAMDSASSHCASLQHPSGPHTSLATQHISAASSTASGATDKGLPFSRFSDAASEGMAEIMSHTAHGSPADEVERRLIGTQQALREERGKVAMISDTAREYEIQLKAAEEELMNLRAYKERMEAFLSKQSISQPGVDFSVSLQMTPAASKTDDASGATEIFGTIPSDSHTWHHSTVGAPVSVKGEQSLSAAISGSAVARPGSRAHVDHGTYPLESGLKSPVSRSATSTAAWSASLLKSSSVVSTISNGEGNTIRSISRSAFDRGSDPREKSSAGHTDDLLGQARGSPPLSLKPGPAGGGTRPTSSTSVSARPEYSQTSPPHPPAERPLASLSHPISISAGPLGAGVKPTARAAPFPKSVKGFLVGYRAPTRSLLGRSSRLNVQQSHIPHYGGGEAVRATRHIQPPPINPQYRLDPLFHPTKSQEPGRMPLTGFGMIGSQCTFSVGSLGIPVGRRHVGVPHQPRGGELVGSAQVLHSLPLTTTYLGIGLPRTHPPVDAHTVTRLPPPAAGVSMELRDAPHRSLSMGRPPSESGAHSASERSLRVAYIDSSAACGIPTYKEDSSYWKQRVGVLISRLMARPTRFNQEIRHQSSWRNPAIFGALNGRLLDLRIEGGRLNFSSPKQHQRWMTRRVIRYMHRRASTKPQGARLQQRHLDQYATDCVLPKYGRLIWLRRPPPALAKRNAYLPNIKRLTMLSRPRRNQHRRRKADTLAVADSPKCHGHLLPTLT